MVEGNLDLTERVLDLFFDLGKDKRNISPVGGFSNNHEFLEFCDGMMQDFRENYLKFNKYSKYSKEIIESGYSRLKKINPTPLIVAYKL